MEELEEEVPVIILDRQAKIDSLISKLMNHESWLSFSSLNSFRESPKDFIDYKFKEKKTTDAMLFGSMVHCLVLEPDDFENRYAVLDDQDICVQIGGLKPRSTNKYKEWKEVFLAEIGKREPITQENYQYAKIIAGNVLHNRASRKIFAQLNKREHPIEWEYKNFKFKGFIDGMSDVIVLDFKTCASAKPKKFQRDIVEKGYYLQAAMYLTGIGIMLPYYIIAADKKGGVSVHKLHNHLIEHGLKEYEMLLDQFNACILTDGFDQSYDFFSERHDGIFIADKPAYLY